MKHMKEDLLLRRSQIKDEINKDDYELLVKVQPYCYNDIKREIMEKPEMKMVEIKARRRRLPNCQSNGD